MQVVDTNVVVRLLTADDPDQYRRARKLFEDGHEVLLRTTVILEAAWVLLSVYKLGADDVIAALSALTEVDNVVLEEHVRVLRAFELARAGLDVADAFHVAVMPDDTEFATFDRRLSDAARKADVPVRLL